MSDVEYQAVTFNVANQNRDNIPAGQYRGHIEWLTVWLHGHAKRSIARCTLHIERREHPEFFSPKNSMIAVDVDILADVMDGNISYEVSTP